jgi:hypothetical protein
MLFSKNQDSPNKEIGPIFIRQRRIRLWGRVLACLVAAATLMGAAQPGQQTPPGMPVRSVMPPVQNHLPDVNDQMQMREQQAKQQNFEAANAERKRQIAEDSANLLKLATELKAEVDKTNKDVLSITVIRKADAIEKLAHQVKEKMKLTIGAS